MHKKLFFALIFLICFCIPYISFAEYNPGLIIGDHDLFEFNSMTEAEIQSFLEKKGSGLAGMNFIDTEDGLNKRASRIIYEACQKYLINPKVVLVTLQKEQSLVQAPNPSDYSLDWAMGYGMCDGCTRNTPGIEKFVGFVNQIKMATERLRKYSDAPTIFNYQRGFMYSIDMTDVLILNQATANLYNYTPHISGNYKFWIIWNNWFSYNYPNGTLVKAETGSTVYLIQYGMKRPIKSMSVLISRFDPGKIITISPTELSKYDEATPIQFTQYSLLQTPDKKIYLLVDDSLRHIENEEVFKKIGFNSEEVIDIAWEDINDYKIGNSITMQSVYPLGALLQDNKTGGVYFVKDGIKYPIFAPELLKANFSRLKIIASDDNELAHYEDGNPIKFRDGELIMGSESTEVFVIEDGKRRAITSGEIFEGLGYKWENIIVTNIKALNLHEIGESIDKLPDNYYNIAIN